MKKRVLVITILAAGLLQSSISSAGAAAQGVEVHLPSFKVSLNSYNLELQSDPFPPIVYNDITYVPMTWNNSLRLNLGLEWKGSEGLLIRQQPTVINTSLYEQQALEDNDFNKTYQATIATYPITVNGKLIDNANEPYPILSFRDITYLPLTWRFTHDEFQWTTAWSPQDGFSSIAGNRKYIMNNIIVDSEKALYVSTNIYGTIRINKSLQGMVEGLWDVETIKDYEQVLDQRAIPKIGAKPNQTRLQGEWVMLDDTKLMSIKPLLDQVNKAGYPHSYTENDIGLEDTVLPLGSARLVSLSTALPGQDSMMLLVNGSQATQIDKLPLYRKIDNVNGSYWLTSASKESEPHHITLHEQHLWLIGKDGSTNSINEQLGANVLRVLSTLDDGTLIVLASEQNSEEAIGDVYRIRPDGNAEKVYASVQGHVYADRYGEVFVLSAPENRITKLSSGKSVELSEKMLFLASKGQAQSLDGN
jgi:hypothetical protein